MHWQLSNRAGTILINSCPPGAHGATIAGMHGIGVNTPQAEAVAEATCGFAIDWHIPKGMMFTIGALSMMVALGFPLIKGRTKSVTINFDID